MAISVVTVNKYYSHPHPTKRLLGSICFCQIYHQMYPPRQVSNFCLQALGFQVKVDWPVVVMLWEVYFDLMVLPTCAKISEMYRSGSDCCSAICFDNINICITIYKWFIQQNIHQGELLTISDQIIQNEQIWAAYSIFSLFRVKGNIKVLAAKIINLIVNSYSIIRS